MKKLALLCAAGALVLSPAWMSAQTKSSSSEDVTSQIETLRADLRSDKVKIITEAMNFKEDEAKVFWPIYRQYEAEMSKIDDERIQLIRDYASKYPNIPDPNAHDLVARSFDLDARRIDIRKKYQKKFEEHLPAATVAKFFQLEHRMDLVLQLKLAADLPSLMSVPAKESATQH